MKLTNRFNLGGATNNIDEIAKCVDKWKDDPLTIGKYYIVEDRCGAYWLTNDKNLYGSGYSKEKFISVQKGDLFIPKKNISPQANYNIIINDFFINDKNQLFIHYECRGSRLYESGIQSVESFDQEYQKCD
jgi:hypothetical protein